MSMTTSQTTSEWLRNFKQNIIDTWADEVIKKVSSASFSDRFRLVHNIPDFIEDLASSLNGDAYYSKKMSEICEEHGHQRAKLPELSLQGIIEEYRLLRALIFQVLCKRGDLHERDVQIINDYIDEAIISAARAFEKDRMEIRSQEQKIADLFLKSRSNPLFLLDFHWRIIYINEVALAQANRLSEDALGKILWDIYPELRSGNLEAAIRQTMQERKPNQFDCYFPNLGKWFLADCEPNELGLAVTWTDISETVRYERRLKEQKFLLEELLEQMPAGVRVMDAETGQVSISNWELDCVLEPQNEIYTWKDFGELEAFHDDMTPFRYDEFPSVRAKNGEVVKEQKMLFRRNDGALSYHLVSAKPLRNYEGKITHVITVISDISELKRIQDKYEQSNRDLSLYSATVAHDLKSPINTIASMIEFLSLKNGEKFDEESQEYLHYISNASNRMRKLIDNLLSYAKINEEKSEFREVDLNHVLSDVEKNLKSQIDSTEAQIAYGILPKIHGDEVQLTSLFQNLISNSIKFRSQNRPFIQIGWEETNGNVQLSLKDNGIGFDSKYATKLFEPFQRLYSQAKYEGTGLGLAICKRIVERHKGRIWVTAIPGEGAQFYIEIPKSTH